MTPSTYSNPTYRKENFDKLVEEHYPKYFAFLEKELKANTSQEFLVGESYTIADFALLAAYIAYIDHPYRKDQVLPVLDKYPTLKAYFGSRTPDFKDYISANPERPF